jgi:hypothetical protein
MSNTTNGGGYSLVDYDVHASGKKGDNSHFQTYSIIYKHLARVAAQFTQSVYMVKRGFMPVVELAFVKINGDLAEKGLPAVTFNVTPVDGEADGLMHRRAAKSVSEAVAAVGASLLASIKKLEAKLEAEQGDPNTMLRKAGLVLARAKRETEDARALSVMFGLTEDVKLAFDATEAVIAAERSRVELRKVKKEEAAQ